MTSTMGPIERELRAVQPNWPAIAELSDEAWNVLRQARDSLGIGFMWEKQTLIPDALSEAIEAAEALGL